MISITRHDQRDAADSPIDLMLENLFGYSLPSPERIRHESAWSPDNRVLAVSGWTEDLFQIGFLDLEGDDGGRR